MYLSQITNVLIPSKFSETLLCNITKICHKVANVAKLTFQIFFSLVEVYGVCEETFLIFFSLAEVYGVCEKTFLRQKYQMINYIVMNLKAFIVIPRKEDFLRVIRAFDGIGRYTFCIFSNN